MRVAQFWCSPCGRGFTPPISKLLEGAHATDRFPARAAELIRHGDVTRAAAFLRVPEKTLQHWCCAVLDIFIIGDMIIGDMRDWIRVGGLDACCVDDSTPCIPLEFSGTLGPWLVEDIAGTGSKIETFRRRRNIFEKPATTAVADLFGISFQIPHAPLVIIHGHVKTCSLIGTVE